MPTFTKANAATEPDGPNPFLGSRLGSGVPDEAELAAMTGKAVNIERAFDALLATQGKALAARRAELDERVKESTRGLTADGQAKAIVAKAAGQKADAEYNEHVRAARTATEQARTDMLRQLAEANQRAELVLSLYPSPIQMLAVAGLGSQERTTYHQQIAHAGPAELATLGKYAVASGKTMLAAAILARLDTLPSQIGPKPFTASHFAEAVVGEKHRAVTKAAKTVAAAFQRLVNQNRDFERGKVDLIGKIKDALALEQLNK